MKIIIYFDESIPAAVSAVKKLEYGKTFTGLTHDEFEAVKNGGVLVLGAQSAASITPGANMFEPTTLLAGMALASQ